MRSHTCCFTGHRKLPPGKQAEIAERLERVIVSLYQRGIQYYGAGGALGFDCLAAQTVFHLRESCLGMKLILVLPCLTQTRGWPAADVAEYERIKALADKVVYTSQAYTRGCMYKRNRIWWTTAVRASATSTGGVAGRPIRWTMLKRKGWRSSTLPSNSKSAP